MSKRSVRRAGPIVEPLLDDRHVLAVASLVPVRPLERRQDLGPGRQRAPHRVGREQTVAQDRHDLRADPRVEVDRAREVRRGVLRAAHLEQQLAELDLDARHIGRHACGEADRLEVPARCGLVERGIELEAYGGELAEHPCVRGTCRERPLEPALGFLEVRAVGP